MPNSVNARCFPCKNTLRPSVVHNLTKISSFDQKMWAKETNRFFFQSIFHFFSFSSVFFYEGRGDFSFSFLTFTLFFVVCFSFFLCTIWGEKMNEYNSILCIPVRFFFNALLTKKKLTPNALRKGAGGLTGGHFKRRPVSRDKRAERWTKAVAFWQ